MKKSTCAYSVALWRTEGSVDRGFLIVRVSQNVIVRHAVQRHALNSDLPAAGAS